MKTRIISFLLTLVMLFSCLSLSIFATEDAIAEQNEETTATPMTDAELKALCQSYGIGLDGKVNLTQADIAANATNIIVNGIGGENTPFGITHYGKDALAGIWLDNNKDGNYDTGDTILVDYKLIQTVENDPVKGTYYEWKPIAYGADGNMLDISLNDEGTAFNDPTLQAAVGKQILYRFSSGYANATFSINSFKELTWTQYFTTGGVKTETPGSVSNLVTVENGIPLWNGNYYSGEYLQQTIDADALSVDNYQTNKSLIGASYAITFDIKHIRGVASGSYFFDIPRSNTGNNYATFNADYNFHIDKDGYLWVRDAAQVNSKNAAIAVPTGYQFPDNEWVQLTLYHTPRGLDGIKGNEDDNTYHVYVNGVLIETRQAVQESKIAEWKDNTNNYEFNSASDFTIHWFRMGQSNKNIGIDNLRIYRGDFLECAHSWEYSHKHDVDTNANVLTAKCNWCGKVDSVTTDLSDTSDNCFLDAEGFAEAAKDNANINEIVLNKDLTLTDTTPFGMNYNNGVGFVLDTTTTYGKGDGAFNLNGGDKIILDWKQIIASEDDETGNVYLKWQKPIACGPDGNPINLKLYEEGGTTKFEDPTLQEYAEKGLNMLWYAYNTTSNKWVLQSPTLFEATKECVEIIEEYIDYVEEDGKTVPYYTGYTSGEYIVRSENNTASSAGVYIKNNINSGEFSHVGASYAVTFDFQYLNGGSAPASIFEMRSYTGNSSFSTSGVSFYTLYIDINGYIYAYDPTAGTTDKEKYGYNDPQNRSIYKLDDDEWVQITIWHTPRGIDGVRDVDETTGLIEDGADDNTYHIFINGKYVVSHQAVASPAASKITLADGTEYMMNSASDYYSSMVRFGQRGVTDGDLMAVDDFRMYYGTFIECVHRDANDNLTVENGICKWCKAKVTFHCDICARDVAHNGNPISADVAIVSRSLTLTDSVDMNLYLELSEAIVKNENAKIVLEGANGARKAEIALAGLDAEKDGTYKVTLPLRSIDMTRKVTAAVYEGDEKVSATYTTTVAEYLEAAYKNADTTDKTKDLIVATANYGAYAQKYFAVKNDDPTLDDLLPTEGLKKLEGYTDEVTEAELGEIKDASVTGTGNITFTELSLVLTSTTKIKLYFTADVDDVSEIKVSEGTLGYDEDNEMYYVILDGVAPLNLGTQSEIKITVTVDGSDETKTVNVSVYNCLEAIIAYESAGDDYVNLAKAIYLYGQAAVAYNTNA